MSLYDVIGQRSIADLLTKSLINNRVAHAYIFSGPKGVGKKKMAIELAKALNCHQASGDACNECTSCKRIEHFNHPDVIYVTPEGNTIKIDQIRQLQKEANFKLREAKIKVYIIENAESMTNQAANSLLKFLEEPRTPSVFILLVENFYQLIPTVKSRCQLISFSPLDSKSILKLFDLEEFKEQDILLAAHVSESIEEIKLLIKSDEFVQMKSLMIQWVKEIEGLSQQALHTINDKIMKNDYIKEQLPLFLDLLVLWYRDILSIRVNRKEAVIFKDQIETLQKLALARNEADRLNNIEEILLTKKRLKSHVQPQLALEQMVLTLQEG